MGAMWILGNPDSLPSLEDLGRTMPDTPFARRAAAFREGNVIVIGAYDPWKALPYSRARASMAQRFHLLDAPPVSARRAARTLALATSVAFFVTVWTMLVLRLLG